MELNKYFWGTPHLPPTAPKIVLLHGMGGIGSLWRPIAASLEDHCSILSVDQRGHGKSLGKCESFTPLDYGSDVVETMSKTQFHPAWIVGHSMGVRTAVAAYHLKPEWVCGLILIDLGFSGIAGGGLGKDLGQFLQNLPEHFDSREGAKTYLLTKSPDPSMGQYLSAVLFQNSEKKWVLPFDRTALLKTLKSSETFSVREWIQDAGHAGIPVLVLRGAQSKVWSSEEFASEKKSFSGLSSVVFKEIEGAGHGLPFEQKAKFVEEVLGWVKKK